MVNDLNKKAIFYLLVCSLTYGAAIVVSKIALKGGSNPFSFALMTSFFSAIFSTFYILPKYRGMKKFSKKDWRNIIIIGIIASGITHLTMIFGQSLTSAMNAAFLSKLTGLFTIPFAYFMVKEKISRRVWLPIITVFFGVLLLSTNGALKSPQPGDMIIIFTAVLLGFTNSLAKKTMNKISSNVISGLRFIFGFMFILSVVSFLLWSKSFSSLYDGFWYVITNAILMFVYVFSFYKGVELSNPAIATIFLLVSAIFSAFLAYFLLGEVLSVVQAIGASLILVGAYFIARKGI